MREVIDDVQDEPITAVAGSGLIKSICHKKRGQTCRWIAEDEYSEL